MFEVADQDGDGKLMYEELFAILTAMNDEVGRRSSQSTPAERRMLRQHACQASSTTLKRLVELVDEEGNGWVEWPEFREVLCSAARAVQCSAEPKLRFVESALFRPFERRRAAVTAYAKARAAQGKAALLGAVRCSACSRWTCTSAIGSSGSLTRTACRSTTR